MQNKTDKQKSCKCNSKTEKISSIYSKKRRLIIRFKLTERNTHVRTRRPTIAIPTKDVYKIQQTKHSDTTYLEAQCYKIRKDGTTYVC